ncbi:unnamed protein product [Sphagnum troendelagicum]
MWKCWKRRSTFSMDSYRTLKGGTGTTTTEQQRGGCTQLVQISKENVVDEAKQKMEHLEQSLKAAIEIHKLEVESLKAESLAEAAEKGTHQWVSFTGPGSCGLGLPNLGGIGGRGGTGAGFLEFQQVQEQLMQNPNL